MVATTNLNLPTEKELAVPEVNLSISALRAGAFHLGKYCEQENNEFMLCKQENADPRACLDEGKSVTNCAMSFFRKVKASCHQEFAYYSQCLFKSSGNMGFSQCRNSQAVYDRCVQDKMGLERADYGYFCRVKVHHTDRPRPHPHPPALYPDAAHPLPPLASPPQANYGNRNII